MDVLTDYQGNVIRATDSALEAQNKRMRQLLKKLWVTTHDRDLLREIEEVLGKKGPYPKKSK